MKKGILLPVAALLLAAVILFGLSFGLNSVAVSNAQQARTALMQTLLPGSSTFTAEEYTGEDTNIRSVYKGDNGFVIETTTRGYVDDITMFIGVSNDGKVTGLVVWEMSETFGLGSRAQNDQAFLAQFLNCSGNVAIGTNEADAFSSATGEDTAEETETYVDGITGATVTSKAIARCVNSAIAYVTGVDAGSSATTWGG